MNVGTLIVLTGFFSGMLFLVQRAEKKRRRIVAIFMLLPAELIRRYVFYVSRTPVLTPFLKLTGGLLHHDTFHHSVHSEAWIALILALMLNLFFWLFIGRYNPVHSSDEIRVIGMDD